MDSETTHPREGTETRRLSYPLHVKLETTHPREGTETMPAWQEPEAARRKKQLIPARGRKPRCHSSNSSFLRKQLIPARGRKLLRRKFSPPPRRNNSSPRGDGNDMVFRHLHIVNRNNSSPRGDGNTNGVDTAQRWDETTHPREGTETGNRECFFIAWALETTHPREGTKRA